MKYWHTSKQRLPLEQPLVMAILNITPDSFSDGGDFISVEDALRRAASMIADGADIIDIGGESTRPGSKRISADEEARRVLPVIEAIAKRFDTPISIDTGKSEVAKRAVDAGAEIINDISGFRWDEQIAVIAAESNAGLVLMHSCGTFETMHSQTLCGNILEEVGKGLRVSLEIAASKGVDPSNIALDVGIGFSKTLEQNLDLLANLDKISGEFSDFPILVGTSRKSFIGKLLDSAPVSERLGGSLASVAIAVYNGAKIIRAHDVRETVNAIRVASAVRERKDQ